jgi:hypothetical protein
MFSLAFSETLFFSHVMVCEKKPIAEDDND